MRVSSDGVYIPVAKAYFPYTCVNASQHLAPACVRNYSTPYATYLIDPERVAPSFTAWITDGDNSIISTSPKWELVDKKGDVVVSKYGTTPPPPPALYQYLRSAGADLDATNPLWSSYGFSPQLDSSYRQTGMVLVWDIEVFNWNPPAEPYNGMLAPGIIPTFSGDKRNWRIKQSVKMLPAGSSTFQNFFQSGLGFDTMSAEVALVVNVRGSVYAFDFAILVTSLTSVVVMFGMAQVVTNTLAPHVVEAFDKVHYLRVAHTHGWDDCDVNLCKPEDSQEDTHVCAPHLDTLADGEVQQQLEMINKNSGSPSDLSRCARPSSVSEDHTRTVDLDQNPRFSVMEDIAVLRM